VPDVNHQLPGLTGSGAMSSAHRVAVITDTNELRALADPWRRLLQASPTATAFASPAWVLTWYRHFERRHGLYAVAVWRGAELVGLAPFARTRIGAGPAGFSLLVSAGTEHGDYGDPLLGPDPLPVAEVVADHLAALVRRTTTVVNLRRLREDDPLLDLFEQRGDLDSEPMGQRASNVIMRFADLDDPRGALERLSRKRDLPRRRRRLTERFGDVAYVRQSPDTPAALAAMRDFLSRRWPAGEGPRLFASPGRAAFTRDVTAELVAAGLGQVSMLTAGGHPVAVGISHRVGGREVFDATSYDPDLKRFSVGLPHLHEVLSHALADGAAEVDMRAGDFSYKEQWSTTTRDTRSIALVRAGGLGRAQLAARRVAMSIRARRLAGRECELSA
jgi:CelD/BcsL family acetyltransferase involved in cellulose biosynthesis